jgi:Amt family ammonium transporter
MKSRYRFTFLILALIAFGAIFLKEDLVPVDNPAFDKADIAWMLTASGLVLLMTPGLSFFYGGMVSKKNIISTMLQSFISLGVVTLLYVIVGFSLCFGDSYYGIIGNPFQYFFFRNVGLNINESLAPTIPILLFAIFQLKFAIITPALITGSFSRKLK